VRIAIVGSRNFPDLSRVDSYVASLPAGTTIVSGGAAGVDRAAECAAERYGLGKIIFPALWGAYGKSAGFKRNVQIVGAADKVAAFWDGVSRGTQHTINIAKERKVPVEIHYPDGRIECSAARPKRSSAGETGS
jgi:hypothetical protein